MQFVNDDMDDLFRRAAEEYPLKTDSGDWNKMMDKMQAAGNDPNDAGKKGNRKRYFFLLMLIPLLLLCTTYIKNNHSTVDGGETNKKISNEQSLQGNKTEPVKPGLLQDNSNKNFSNRNVTRSNTNSVTWQTKTSQPNSFSIAGSTLRNNHDNVRDSKNDNIPPNNKRESLPFSSKVESSGNKEKTTTDANEMGQETKATTSGNIQKSGRDNRATLNPESSTIAEDKKPVKEKSQEIADVPAAKEKKAKKQATKLYLSLLGGPDFSMVKSTKIRGTGYSVGLLAGYNFNKKLAVETGVLWDRKKYESEGQYFKTEKLNWPHVTIYDLWGYCEMYEIPLNLRYNFSANTKRIFFATAGVSSYLMKTENYNYHYIRYGVQGYGNKEYKNSSKDWLSVAHISVGVQKKLGAIGDLRIEPYIKLPVNGVGIGSMPLRSTGVYLGIARPIR